MVWKNIWEKIKGTRDPPSSWSLVAKVLYFFHFLFFYTSHIHEAFVAVKSKSCRLACLGQSFDSIWWMGSAKLDRPSCIALHLQSIKQECTHSVWLCPSLPICSAMWLKTTAMDAKQSMLFFDRAAKLRTFGKLQLEYWHQIYSLYYIFIQKRK